MGFWMPLLMLGLALLYGLVGFHKFRKHRAWSHPAVKAYLRVAGVMLVVTLFLVWK
jgi:hypothetical protein